MWSIHHLCHRKVSLRLAISGAPRTSLRLSQHLRARSMSPTVTRGLLAADPSTFLQAVLHPDVLNFRHPFLVIRLLHIITAQYCALRTPAISAGHANQSRSTLSLSKHHELLPAVRRLVQLISLNQKALRPFAQLYGDAFTVFGSAAIATLSCAAEDADQRVCDVCSVVGAFAALRAVHPDVCRAAAQEVLQQRAAPTSVPLCDSLADGGHRALDHMVGGIYVLKTLTALLATAGAAGRLSFDLLDKLWHTEVAGVAKSLRGLVRRRSNAEVFLSMPLEVVQKLGTYDELVAAAAALLAAATTPNCPLSSPLQTLARHYLAAVPPELYVSRGRHWPQFPCTAAVLCSCAGIPWPERVGDPLHGLLLTARTVTSLSSSMPTSAFRDMYRLAYYEGVPVVALNLANHRSVSSPRVTSKVLSATAQHRGAILVYSPPQDGYVWNLCPSKSLGWVLSFVCVSNDVVISTSTVEEGNCSFGSSSTAPAQRGKQIPLLRHTAEVAQFANLHRNVLFVDYKSVAWRPMGLTLAVSYCLLAIAAHQGPVHVRLGAPFYTPQLEHLRLVASTENIPQSVCEQASAAAAAIFSGASPSHVEVMSPPSKWLMALEAHCRVLLHNATL